MGERLVTHDEIANQVAKLLRENDFYVRMRRSIPLERLGAFEVYHALTGKKREWTKIVDILGLKMRTGGYGPLVQGTNGKRLDLFGDSIAVEVSNSTDLKGEVEKIRRLPVHLRLIVTTDSRMRGELAGIPVVPHDKLDDAFIAGLRQVFFCPWAKCDYFTTDHNELSRHSKKHEESEILREELPETSG
jgi:hypothetical protein